ncbi:MAG: hypothetical protein E6J54_19465, partial [Deltaproteobacteria bacterium]
MCWLSYKDCAVFLCAKSSRLLRSCARKSICRTRFRRQKPRSGKPHSGICGTRPPNSSSFDDAEQLADFLAPNLNIDVAEKQAILEELDVEKRVRAVQKHISAQLEIAEIQQRLQRDVASQFSDAQRRAYLRSQIKAIQRELGEAEAGSEEQAQQLRKRLEEANPPEAVMKQAERELKRLDFIPSASPEFSVIVSYIEIIADLPWNNLSKDNLDLDQAQQILDR